jgi:hypothetical protein
VREQTEFRELMEEPPGGVNTGRAASRDPNVEGRFVALGVAEAQAAEFAREGGWSLAQPHAKGRYGDSTGGLTAHRGVLQGDEYVDASALLKGIEAEFGFTVEQVRSVYRRGRLTALEGELRVQIDARLLALSRSGANLAVLARIFGLTYDPTRRTYEVVERALARAKAAELQTEGSH